MFWKIELVPWYALLAVWAVAALRVKQDKVTEPIARRLFHVICVALAFVLLFSRTLPLGPLRHQVFGSEVWLQWIGIALTYIGAALAIWARLRLGDNWSSRVNLKQDHQLVSSGPYAFVRHPIYTGFLTAVVGTAIEVGEWRGVLATALVAVAHTLKARREEEFMVSEFGQRYVDYQKQTGFLLPRL